MAKHLTLEERDRIAHLKSRGFSQATIAKAIERSPSVISRELRRNRAADGTYYGGVAQLHAAQRRAERPLERRMDRPEIRSAVQRGLHHDWSPDQISGRLRESSPKDQTSRVSASTIYTWIEKDEQRDLWKGHLRRRGKRPQRRKKTPRPEHQRIDGRPEVIEQRGRLGDLEGDTVLGPPATGGVITMVDRLSRRLTMTKITHKHADHVAKCLIKRLKKSPDQPVRSMTFDNGTEFAECDKVAKRHRARLFFARPGCPQQRGTNENMNGLIRQYFPKVTEFNTVSPARIRQVEKLINDRPRRCLGYKTPIEVSRDNYADPDCISDS
jgi:IS30 family transposase